MFRRRQRKPPKAGHKSELQSLLEQLAVGLASSGTVKAPAGPWIVAARVSIVALNSCGMELGTIEQDHLGRMLTAKGWGWAWEGEAVVFTLPGWVQSAPVIVAIQSSLFSSTPKE